MGCTWMETYYGSWIWPYFPGFLLINPVLLAEVSKYVNSLHFLGLKEVRVARVSIVVSEELSKVT